jgi:hypothetical protein
MNEHIPTKLIRGNKNKKPWISKEVKSLISKRNKQYKKYKKTKDKIDLKRFKETKAHLQKTERQSYWKYINNIIEIGTQTRKIDHQNRKDSGHTSNH